MTAVARAVPRALTGPLGAGRLTIDLGAIDANARLFAARTTGSLIAVVKADGFGHGAPDVARTALAAGASGLGVTSIGEALELRAAGISASVLSWLNPVDADWAAAVGHDVEVAVGSRDHLDAVLAASLGARVHLHLDTGMARDGAAPTEWAALCRAARRAELQGRLQVVGMMGHLPCAEDPDHVSNGRGRHRYAWGLMTARATGLRPTQRHLAATSATLLDPLTHHTASRVGAGLVGIDPSGTTTLRPAMTLRAPLVEIRDVRGGTPVGYGHAWTTPHATRLGLLPLGYADGLPRLAADGGPGAEVQVLGRRVPVVGRISMDSAVIDLGDLPAVPGTPVTVFGPGEDGEPTVRDWARAGGVLEHEIVTGLGRRTERVVRPVTALRSIS
ncbi:MAG: alanine racemase [Marmoricola sp.]